MLILQAFFLWLIIAALMTGGAMLFHRYFSEESPWLGFIVPPLAVVLLLNFLEHLIALPVLLYLLPLLLGATLWMAIGGKFFRPALKLPTAIFLSSFAFTFAIRCLQPDISYTSDGISDLNMINNFMQGETAPPPDTWLPPYRFEWYYCLQHYAGSVVERLLGVKIGVANNVSHALLDALICFVAAATAHRLSRGSVFITGTMVVLIVTAFTGVAAYLLFAGSPDQWLVYDLSTGMNLHHDNDDSLWKNPLWEFLRWDPRAGISHRETAETLRLQVPGFWIWRDEYHANAAGHLLTLLSVFVVAELAEVKKTIWPWVLAVIIPLLAATATAWALPITVILCWVILPLAWWAGRRPASLNLALWTLFGSVILIWPAFYNVTSNPELPQMTWIDPKARTPLLEFVVQWWPIIALWICGLALFRKLSFGARWLLAALPLMLLFVETVTIESRYNMVEKMWGYTWCIGLAGLFPIVASQRNVVYRLVAVVIIAAALPNLYNHCANVVRWMSHPFALEGSRYITDDEQKQRIMQKLGEKQKLTYLTGICAYCYNEAPAVAVFTQNRSYLAWYWYEQRVNFAKEVLARKQEDEDFYSGAMTDRLRFLQDKQIYGVIIWPDDDISDAKLDALKKELDPAYEYNDYKGSGSKNAGVFVLRAMPRS